MNLENLEVGLIYKNYKELCKVLCEPVLAGNSKKAQIKEWERNFSYENQGYKFIIKEVYKTPLSKLDKRKEGGNVSPYMEELEILILDLLAQDQNNGIVNISKNRLYNELKMINDNYTEFANKRLVLSELINADISNVDEFYTSSNNTFKGNIETALKRLANQSLIYWNYAITVCYASPNINYTENGSVKMKKKTFINEDGFTKYELQATEISGEISHREATKKEIQVIKEVERNIMTDTYSCDTIQEVYNIGKIKEFYTKVNDILFDRLNILYYYNSYSIIFNQDNINKKLSDLLLANDVKNNYRLKLNAQVMKKLKQNAVKRQDKSENKYLFDAVLSKNDCRRVSDQYIQDMDKLNYQLIAYGENVEQINLEGITTSDFKCSTFEIYDTPIQSDHIIAFEKEQLPF